MKKVVCILVLSLAAMTVAYGQVAEPLLPSASPPSGPGVAPVVVVEPPPVAQPTEAAPPAIHSTPAVRRVPGVAPGPMPGMVEAVPSTRPEGAGFGMTTATPWPATGGQGAGTFTLSDPEKGVRYGPFPLQPGVTIVVGGVRYVFQMAGVAPPPEEERTPEQLALENKLRKALIPLLELEGASLMEVVRYLAVQSETNIVVTGPVQKRDFSFALSLQNIPLYDAIRYVTEVTGVHFRIDDHAVVITDEVPVPIGMPMTPRSHR